METYPLVLSVPRADTARGMLRLRHTAYLVQIDDCGRVYERHRRYTNFLWLHRELRQREVAGLPELPPKRAVGSLDQAFVEQRRRLLEAYLRALLRLPAVVLDDTLWAFLDADLATAAVPRFLCRPASPAGAFDCLNQLASVATRDGSAFRLCNLAVLRELARFTQAEAAEAAAQAQPQAQAALQARLGSRLRLCAVTQALVRHERARQGLAEVDMFGALLALLWRATEDSRAAEEVAGGEADSHRAACQGIQQCLSLLLEVSGGVALLDFCQQDAGLRELQRLAVAETTSLHATVAQLLWQGFQSGSVVAAFAGSNMGLPLIGKLLQSPELTARVLASLCVICLVRQDGALDPDAREHCLEALEPLPGELEKAEAEAVQRAAATTLLDSSATEGPGGNGLAAADGACALAAERNTALVELLRMLCSPGEVPRLQALLGDADGHPVADSATAAVLALLDNFALQSLDEPETLRVLNPVAEQLQLLLDAGEAAAAGEAQARAARLLLRLDWAGAAGWAGSREAPPLTALEQRVRVLEAMMGQAEAQQLRAAAQLAAAAERGGRQEQAVRTARLSDEPCLGPGRLEDFRAHLADLTGRRAGLSRGLQGALRALEALGASLDQRGVKRGVFGGDVEALHRAVAAQAVREGRVEDARAAVAGREEASREAAAQHEAQLSLLRNAEADLREASDRSREAEDRAAALAHEEAEKAEICHNAPAQMERLQVRLAEAERRQGAVQQSLAQLGADADFEERRSAALAEGRQEAEAALRTLAQVLQRLQQLRPCLASELVLTDEEVGQLKQLEVEMQPARPARLRQPGEEALQALQAARPAEGDPGEEPPAWEEVLQAGEQAFREHLHFRAFAQLRDERERLWAAELRWLQQMTAEAEATARQRELQRADLEQEGRAAREESERLGRDLAFWGEHEEHRARHGDARNAAADAREAARSESSRAVEAAGGHQLAEARLEQARAGVRDADAALAAAREAADSEVERSLRERLELEKRCLELEARARSHSEGWLVADLEEQHVALLLAQVNSHLHTEAEGRGALRLEIRQLVADLEALDRQLDAEPFNEELGHHG